MEMVDVIKKLREIVDSSPEVAKAIKSVESTTNSVNENPALMALGTTAARAAGTAAGTTAANRVADKFLGKNNKKEVAPPGREKQVRALKGKVDNPYAVAWASYNKSAGSKEAIGDDYAKEGGMSDVHIGAQEAVSEYTNEDGNLDRPKADVLQDMASRKAKMPFPQSFEMEEAMKMVAAEYEDDGSKREVYEPEPDEIMKQDLDAPVVTKTVLNTEAMTKEDKKPLKEAITMSADSPEEAGMLMQILQMAGVKPMGAEMPPTEVPADNDADHDHDNDGEQDHAPQDCNVCAGDDDVGSNAMGKMRDIVTAPDDEQAEETWDNEPDEKVQDVDTLVNVHSGGLNKQKQQLRKEYPGDNPLAVKEEPTEKDLSNSLRNQYESFKKSYQEAAKVAEAKPDFLDMDKDGNKKEPMKKAIADKK